MRYENQINRVVCDDLANNLEVVVKAEAKKRQKERGGTAPGRTKDTSGKLPEAIDGDTRGIVETIAVVF